MIENLVEEAKKGSEDAMERLYGLFLKKIYNYVFMVVKDEDEAKEITQETFFKAFFNIKKLKNNRFFEQWLYKIARNEVLQTLKRKKRFVGDEDLFVKENGKYHVAAVDMGTSPEKKCLDGELKEIIDRAIDLLPPKQKEVFVLAVIQKKSYAEVSEIVGRSLLSVKSDIFRARSSVKEYIKKNLGLDRNGN